jgi:hypothetical protein
MENTAFCEIIHLKNCKKNLSIKTHIFVIRVPISALPIIHTVCMVCIMEICMVEETIVNKISILWLFEYSYRERERQPHMGPFYKT